MAGIHDDEFTFEIEAFTPETIPMERLAQYMAVFAKLLANTDSIHFEGLRSGSTKIVARAEHEAIPKVSKRLSSIKATEAPKDALEAIDAANEMLRDDNAVGRIFHGQSKQKHGTVIFLAGREIPRPKKIGPFNEAVTVKGELVRLEGEDATKHAGIKDAQGRVWSGDMTLETAKQLAPFAWEWVQVDGIARWVRNEAGKWEMRSFHIIGGRGLPKHSLEDDVANLRKIKGNEWQDATEFMPITRSEDDELH